MDHLEILMDTESSSPKRRKLDTKVEKNEQQVNHDDIVLELKEEAETVKQERKGEEIRNKNTIDDCDGTQSVKVCLEDDLPLSQINNVQSDIPLSHSDKEQLEKHENEDIKIETLDGDYEDFSYFDDDFEELNDKFDEDEMIKIEMDDEETNKYQQFRKCTKKPKIITPRQQDPKDIISRFPNFQRRQKTVNRSISRTIGVSNFSKNNWEAVLSKEQLPDSDNFFNLISSSFFDVPKLHPNCNKDLSTARNAALSFLRPLFEQIVIDINKTFKREKEDQFTFDYFLDEVLYSIGLSLYKMKGNENIRRSQSNLRKFVFEEYGLQAKWSWSDR